MEQPGQVADADSSRANIALGLAVVGVVLYIIAMIVAQEENGWLWPVAGLIGGAGAIAGWQAGRPRPQGKTMAAVVLGGLVFLTVLGWTIWALATGNF